MNISEINKIYFLGIGGIGMSALARYFLLQGKIVVGYDRIRTALTKDLECEGAEIHYIDQVDMITDDIDLVVYTPAIPSDLKEYNLVLEKKMVLKKRSEVLGLISNAYKGIAVAGTHGKTTTSTMIAHLMKDSPIAINAFLGGISKNIKSNFLWQANASHSVVEADEFDRSFLALYPYLAIITSMDADHLDIYEKEDNLTESFELFIEQIQSGGCLIYKHDLSIKSIRKDIQKYSYGMNSAADFYARNIRLENGRYIFDFVGIDIEIKNIVTGMPGMINIENAVAAIAASVLSGVESVHIQQAMPEFQGIKRRFDIHYLDEKNVYIDDYAHHPAEIKASLNSVKEMFPGRHISCIFQPHLFSRTRDFALDFAHVLSQVDCLILLEIYPARELPIEGISSDMLKDKCSLDNVVVCKKENVFKYLDKSKTDILLSLGAGDIDQLVTPLTKWIKEN